ncbi:MAG: hypothetical protein H7A41_07745 [Chlamydiales bacterium]|nr:hypothetical protein [Chlamydiales bacterium]
MSSSVTIDDFVVIDSNPSPIREDDFVEIEKQTGVEMLARRVIPEEMELTKFNKYFGNTHRVFSYVRPAKVYQDFFKTIGNFFQEHQIDERSLQSDRSPSSYEMITGRFTAKAGGSSYRFTCFNFKEIENEQLGTVGLSSQLKDYSERTWIGFNTSGSTPKVEITDQPSKFYTVPGMVIEKYS